MIRVNLARNRTGEATIGRTTIGSTAGSADAFENRQGLLKVALILIFVVGMVLIENQELGALRQQAARLQGQVSELETESASKAKETESIKDIEAQARELEAKLKILKLLSKLRLREVKTLDFMQSQIPEKVWLTSLTFETDKNRLEEGKFNFVGKSTNTDDLTEFVKRLEDSSYLQEVILVKNQDVAAVDGSKQSVREFNFTALVESRP